MVTASVLIVNAFFSRLVYFGFLRISVAGYERSSVEALCCQIAKRDNVTAAFT